MSTAFDALFASAGFPVLLGQFGETIYYYSSRTGRAREIQAIVNREPPSMYVAGNVVSPRFAIRVLNDATSGISSEEVNLGNGWIELYAKIGDADLLAVSIHSLTSQDAGVTGLNLL